MYQGLVFMKKLSLMMDKGFTLIEVLLTPSILSINLVISIPSIGSVIAKSDEKACHANQQLIEEVYQRELLFVKFDITFITYMIEQDLNQCPSKGLYTLKEEKVICSKHPREFKIEKPPSQVPWL
jgi:prepilin-type N-terminal cleavage/methylation domain-containing protein